MTRASSPEEPTAGECMGDKVAVFSTECVGDRDRVEDSCGDGGLSTTLSGGGGTAAPSPPPPATPQPSRTPSQLMLEPLSSTPWSSGDPVCREDMGAYSLPLVSTVGAAAATCKM